METEVYSALAVIFAIGFVLTVLGKLFWRPVSTIIQNIAPDRESRYRLLAIIVILGFAIIGGFVSIAKMFMIIASG